MVEWLLPSIGKHDKVWISRLFDKLVTNRDSNLPAVLIVAVFLSKYQQGMYIPIWIKNLQLATNAVNILDFIRRAGHNIIDVSVGEDSGTPFRQISKTFLTSSLFYWDQILSLIIKHLHRYLGDIGWRIASAGKGFKPFLALTRPYFVAFPVFVIFYYEIVNIL